MGILKANGSTAAVTPTEAGKVLLAVPEFQQAVSLLLLNRDKINNILGRIDESWKKIDAEQEKAHVKETERFKKRAQRKRQNQEKLSLAEKQFRQQLDTQDHFIVVSLRREVRVRAHV